MLDVAPAETDVRLQRAGAVVTITLDRPRARNAVRARTLDALEPLLDALAADREARAVILAGAGPAFCAGIDLGEAAALAGRSAQERGRFLERLQNLTRRLHALPQVTIAALDGTAVGLGAELAIACDLRVMGPAASLRFPELRHGLFPTNGVTALLPRLVGAGVAASLLLRDRPLDAGRAVALGLAEAADGAALPAAQRWADDVLEARPDALRLAVMALRARAAEDLEAAMACETQCALTLSGAAG